jgi:hypothetical protein
MIQALQDLSKQLPLATQYTWDVPANPPINIPSTITTPFDRNLYLKRNLHSNLATSNNKWDTYFWIIQEWGGIKSFKNTSKNQIRITKFFRELVERKLTKDSHSLLPSLSKLAAFNEPEEYSIYDSRAVFALNWLIFCHKNEPVLFPQPPSRNKTLIEIDTQTLFRLSGRPYTIKSHKTAYLDYCKTLKDLSCKALNQKEPFCLEMLLFVAAEKWIPDDIKARVNVTIR